MSVSGDDYSGELSSSGLTVEEQLAGGATVGDLISAGVLYDDYPAGCDFTEEVPAPRQDLPPRTKEETEKLIAKLKRGIKAGRLGKDAPPRPV